jgi:hypothetical protein
LSYIVESGASSSRRGRRRRALITLTLVLLMLFFAFWYAYSYYQASGKPAATPSPSCTTTPVAAAPLPRDITVNVYNATSRTGLAAKTAAEVRKRGFVVATVSNDPLQRKVPGTVELRYGASGTEKAKVVAALVRRAQPVVDARTDSSVDLVLGDRFVGLAAPVKAPAKPAPAQTTAKTTPKPTAKPTGTATTAPAAPATTPAC